MHFCLFQKFMQQDMDCSTLNASGLNFSSVTIQMNSSGVDSYENPDRKRPVSLVVAAFQISMAAVPVEALSLVILASAGLVNGFVLTAMFRVSSATLPAKFLLVNNLIANVTFPLSSKIPPIIIWICMAYGLTDPLIFVCLDLITFVIPPYALVAQGLSTLTLACDRVYAICFPLVYKTTGYSKPVKWLIIFAQLLTCLSFLLPAIIIPLQSIKNAPTDSCTTLIPGYFSYTVMVRPVCLLTITIVTFALYTFIFVHLKCKTLVKQAERHGEFSRKSISLTVVYFLVHFTTVLLSAPVSVYSVIVEVFASAPPSGNSRLLLQLFLMLLLMNSILDPIILTWKIAVIRKKLPFSLNVCVSGSRETSRNPSSSTRFSNAPDIPTATSE